MARRTSSPSRGAPEGLWQIVDGREISILCSGHRESFALPRFPSGSTEKERGPASKSGKRLAALKAPRIGQHRSQCCRWKHGWPTCRPCLIGTEACVRAHHQRCRKLCNSQRNHISRFITTFVISPLLTTTIVTMHARRSIVYCVKLKVVSLRHSRAHERGAWIANAS